MLMRILVIKQLRNHGRIYLSLPPLRKVLMNSNDIQGVATVCDITSFIQLSFTL